METFFIFSLFELGGGDQRICDGRGGVLVRSSLRAMTAGTLSKLLCSGARCDLFNFFNSSLKA